MAKFIFKTRCVEVKPEHVSDLEEMYAHQKPVTWKTMRRMCEGIDQYSKRLGYNKTNCRIENDPCIRFYRSRFQGKRCYNMEWSCIDHIWIESE